MRVGRSNDVISLKRRVGNLDEAPCSDMNEEGTGQMPNLSDDVLVGETDDKSVLGCVVLVLVLGHHTAGIRMRGQIRRSKHDEGYISSDQS